MHSGPSRAVSFQNVSHPLQRVAVRRAHRAAALAREPRRIELAELPEGVLHDLLGDHVSVDPRFRALALARDGARRVALRGRADGRVPLAPHHDGGGQERLLATPNRDSSRNLFVLVLA